MARFSVLIEVGLICLMCQEVYILPLKRATSFGGILVRVIREGNNQLLSVSSEGNVFSNGANSEMDTCFQLTFPDTNGRIELASAVY